MNEQLFYWLSFCIIFLFGILLGGFIAAKFQIFIKFSKKEDYEEKVKQLEEMIEKMEKPAEVDFKPSELFPPGVSPEYGLPRKLTKD